MLHNTWEKHINEWINNEYPFICILKVLLLLLRKSSLLQSKGSSSPKEICHAFRLHSWMPVLLTGAYFSSMSFSINTSSFPHHIHFEWARISSCFHKLEAEAMTCSWRCPNILRNNIQVSLIKKVNQEVPWEEILLCNHLGYNTTTGEHKEIEDYPTLIH